jgi:predicted ferric reductase
VGLGQVGFYLAAIVAGSVYVRKQIGYKAWRALHYASFVLYLIVTLHGLFAGTDAADPRVRGMYLVTSLVVYFLMIVRIFAAIRAARSAGHDTVPTSRTSSLAR